MTNRGRDEARFYDVSWAHQDEASIVDQRCCSIDIKWQSSRSSAWRTSSCCLIFENCVGCQERDDVF